MILSDDTSRSFPIVAETSRPFIAKPAHLIPQRLRDNAQVRNVRDNYLVGVSSLLRPLAGLRMQHGAICIPNQLADVQLIPDHAPASHRSADKGLVVPVSTAAG